MASGIAASLGVSSEGQQHHHAVSISELVVTDLPSVSQQQHVVYLSNGQPVQVLQASQDGSSLVMVPEEASSPTVETAMARLHEGGSSNGKQQQPKDSFPAVVGDKKAKAISQIADDWDDEDDI